MFRKRAIPAVTAPVEDEAPPCRLWSRRRVLFLLTLLALPLAVRWWWGGYAQRRLDAAIAELRARGEPVAEADFADPAVPDEQNAAFYLRRAAGRFVLTGQQREDEGREGFYVSPLSPEAVASIAGLLRDNRQALADVQKARAMPSVRWDSPPLTADDAQRWRFARAISREHRLRDLLRYGVMHARATGDHSEAVERLRDMLFLADRFGRRGFVTAHLLANGIAAGAAEEAAAVAAGMRVGESPGAATRGQVEGLIHDLLDADAARRNALESVRRERVLAIRYARVHSVVHWYGRPDEHGEMVFVTSPQWLNVAVSWVTRPYALLHAERSLKYQTALYDVLQSVDEKFQAPLPPRKPDPETGLFGVEWVTKCFGRDELDRVPGLHQAAMTQRAGAAVALASRLFELDHGRPPASTAELVPRYVPAGARYLPALGTPTPATRPSTQPGAP